MLHFTKMFRNKTESAIFVYLMCVKNSNIAQPLVGGV